MKKYRIEWTEREIVASYYCEEFEVDDDHPEITNKSAWDLINDGLWDRNDLDYERIPDDLLDKIPPYEITSIIDKSPTEDELLRKQLSELSSELSRKEVWIMNTNVQINELRKQKEELELKLKKEVL